MEAARRVLLHKTRLNWVLPDASGPDVEVREGAILAIARALNAFATPRASTVERETRERCARYHDDQAVTFRLKQGAEQLRIGPSESARHVKWANHYAALVKVHEESAAAIRALAPSSREAGRGWILEIDGEAIFRADGEPFIYAEDAAAHFRENFKGRSISEATIHRLAALKPAMSDERARTQDEYVKIATNQPPAPAPKPEARCDECGGAAPNPRTVPHDVQQYPLCRSSFHDGHPASDPREGGEPVAWEHSPLAEKVRQFVYGPLLESQQVDRSTACCGLTTREYAKSFQGDAACDAVDAFVKALYAHPAPDEALALLKEARELLDSDSLAGFGVERRHDVVARIDAILAKEP